MLLSLGGVRGVRHCKRNPSARSVLAELGGRFSGWTILEIVF
jgi:hypothetical protein